MSSHRNRRIVKEGPTGFITTSTRSLDSQMSTRVLEMTITDTEEQTRKIMESDALRASGIVPEQEDVEAFHALQRWIASQDLSEPVIPFAPALQRLLPANVVRLRRDFKKVLTMIKAVALLYQCQRQRDHKGRIICTLEDYGIVRELVSSIFDAAVSDGVTDAIRETVEAVPEEDEITQRDLATALKQSKQTVSYRVGRARDGGWLVNNEQRKGHPARIARGVPLPEPDGKSALPTVAAVMEVSNCQTPMGGGTSTLPPVVATCPECGSTDGRCWFDEEAQEWVCARW